MFFLRNGDQGHCNIGHFISIPFLIIPNTEVVFSLLQHREGRMGGGIVLYIKESIELNQSEKVRRINYVPNNRINMGGNT